MPYYKFSRVSPLGHLLIELDERVKTVEEAALKFINSLSAYTYYRDERFIAGSIIGILYQREPHKRILRKSLKKVGEINDGNGNIYYNYFPNDTTEGKELFSRMRELPEVKEAELNYLFGVKSIGKAVNYILCDGDIIVVAIKEGVSHTCNANASLLEEITEDEAMVFINEER